MLFIGWSLMFQGECVKLVSMAGNTPTPAAMRIITLSLLIGKTWEEAREDCRGKNADFAVIRNQNEKVIRKLWEFFLTIMK